MLRKIHTLPRLLLALLVVAVAAGCDSDQVKRTSDQNVGGVSPIFIFLDVTASKGTITAGEEEKPVKITVFAVFADSGAPVSGTVNLTTTLGGFDSVGGPSSINLTLENGLAEASFFPGDTAGTARIRASLQGVTDQVSIIIKPFVEPIPPPTASSLSLSANPTVVSEEDDPAAIDVVATVVGSNAEPFENAPVQFSAPFGEFSDSLTNVSDIQATDANGEILLTLEVSAAELQLFPSDTFDITATLFMEGGAQTSTTVTITIIRADAPPTPTSIVLSANPSTIDDDGSEQVVTLSATVRDQNGALMSGVDVDFSTELGSVSPTTSATVSGVATTTLTVPAGTVAGYPFDSFEAQASMGVQGGGTASDTVTIGIIRPAPSVTADFTWDTDASLPNEDPAPCHDSLEGTSLVQFEDLSTGPVTTWEWDLDGDNSFDDANVPDPTFDYGTGAFTAGVPINVRLRVTNGGAAVSTVTHPITPQDCP